MFEKFKNILIFLYYNLIKRFSGYYHQGIKGEALPINAPIYVYREADKLLYEFVKASSSHTRAYYILAAHQMGKSSLMGRTAKKLTDEGAICIQVALQMSEQALSEQSLYLSFLGVICQRFTNAGISLVPELEAFWQEAQDIPPARRFQEFVQKVLQKIGNQKIIFFIDDIQTLVYSQLQDSLISLIRALSESNEQSLQRLTFVLLGVAKPSDLFTETGCGLEAAKSIELEPLKGDCQPLLAGLKKVSKNPADVLKEILFWTGGQPFLTQVLCDLVAKQIRIDKGADVKKPIEELVRSEIIQNWRSQERLSSHFQWIENWFVRGDPERIAEQLSTLNMYKRILQNSQSVKFNERSGKQIDLLISGLAAKSGEFIDAANPIYQQIFNLKWVKETRKIVNQERDKMATVYNRDVFILIDRSGSMLDEDSTTNGQTRYKYLQETVRGHIAEILSEEDDEEGRICEEVSVYFFNANRPPQKTNNISNAALIRALFKENRAGGATFIAPTLEHALSKWVTNRTNDKGAFIIIYTDGVLDDSQKFVDLIDKTCAKLNSQDEIKILMIGIGSDIQKKEVIEFYLDLDQNTNQFKSKLGEDCDIFVFDLIDDVMDMGIVEALGRQLGDNPREGLAEWVRERYPQLYEKYFG